jgi:hypothetical protein
MECAKEVRFDARLRVRDFPEEFFVELHELGQP